MDFLDKATASMKGGKADSFFEAGEYKKALQVYLQVLKTKIEKGEPVELAPYYQKIADCYMKLKPGLEEDRVHNTEKASEYYKRAGEKYEEQGDIHRAGVAYESAASCFEILEEHENASEYNRKSANLYAQSGEGVQAGHSFEGSAEQAFSSGDYLTAAQSYVQAAEHALDLMDDTKASDGYEKAAKAWEQQGDLQKAMEHYQLAVGLFDKIKAYDKAALAYESIGRCREKVGDKEAAIKNYLKAAQINESKKNHSNIIGDYMACGRCYEELGKQEDAISHYTMASDVALSAKDAISQATSLTSIARCQESLRQFTTSITNYMAAGDAYLSAEKRLEASDSFKKALDLSLSEAKSAEARGDFTSSSANYKTASLCYYMLKDYERAADLMYEQATSLLKDGNEAEAFERYSEAADSYVKSNLIDKAADSYMRAKKYEEASQYYIKHAEKASKGKNYFESGKFHDLASWCLKKIEDYKGERDAMNSSIWQYVAFLDDSKDQPDTLQDAEANLRIGQGNLKLEDTRKALKSMTDAAKLYEKLGDAKMKDVANAQVKLIEGKIALKAADYVKATENLSAAIEFFKKLNLNEFEEFDRAYLSERKQDAERFIREIEARPDVELVFPQPDDIVVKAESQLTAEIINKGTQPVERIVILPSLPSTIEVKRVTKKCDQLPAGEKFKVDLTVYPTETGSYVFRPLEILYHDKEGRKYMKSANEITLNTVSEKKVEMKAEVKKEEEASELQVTDKIMRGFLGADSTSIVLVSYDPASHMQIVGGILDVLVNERKEGGVYISVSKPYKHVLKLMEEKNISAENVKFIDCITRATGNVAEKTENVVYVENPASLEEISMYSDKLIKDITSEKKFLFIDSISSLLIYNEERSIEELIHFLVNQIRSDGVGGVILSTDETSTQSIIRRLIPTCDKEIKV